MNNKVPVPPPPVDINQLYENIEKDINLFSTKTITDNEVIKKFLLKINIFFSLYGNPNYGFPKNETFVMDNINYKESQNKLDKIFGGISVRKKELIPTSKNKVAPSKEFIPFWASGNFNLHEDLYIKMYFIHYDLLLKNNENVALSFFSTLEDKSSYKQYFADNFGHWSLGDEEFENITKNLISKRLAIIKKLLLKKRISESLIIYQSITEFLVALEVLGGPVREKTEEQSLRRIRIDIFGTIDAIIDWDNKAEQVLKNKNKEIENLKIKISETNKLIKDYFPEAKKSEFQTKINKMVILINEINQIQIRCGKKEMFSYKDVSENVAQLNEVTNKTGWEQFVNSLYRMFYDGSGQGKYLPNFFKNAEKFDKDFILMDIKHLRTEKGHGNLDKNAEKKIANVYQKYVNKKHYAQLNKPEIKLFQTKILDNLICFLEKIIKEF